MRQVYRGFIIEGDQDGIGVWHRNLKMVGGFSDIKHAKSWVDRFWSKDDRKIRFDCKCNECSTWLYSRATRRSIKEQE